MSQATTTLTIEVPLGIEERLEELARATSRSKTWLAQEALRSFVDLFAEVRCDAVGTDVAPGEFTSLLALTHDALRRRDPVTRTEQKNERETRDALLAL